MLWNRRFRRTFTCNLRQSNDLFQSLFLFFLCCYMFPFYIYSYYTEACSFHSLGCRYHINPSKIMQCNQLTNRLYQYYICNTYTSAHGFWLGHKLETLLGGWGICLFDSCGSMWCYRDIPNFELVSNSHHFTKFTTNNQRRSLGGRIYCLDWSGEKQMNVSVCPWLTHWPLGDLRQIYRSNFQANFGDWWLKYLLWNCPHMDATGPYWWWVNIGSGNGLVPSGNKPLPEPMLTQFSVAIWRY